MPKGENLIPHVKITNTSSGKTVTLDGEEAKSVLGQIDAITAENRLKSYIRYQDPATKNQVVMELCCVEIEQLPSTIEEYEARDCDLDCCEQRFFRTFNTSVNQQTGEFSKKSQPSTPDKPKEDAPTKPSENGNTGNTETGNTTPTQPSENTTPNQPSEKPMIKGNVHFIGTLQDGSNPIKLIDVPVNGRLGDSVYLKDYITPESLGDNRIVEDGKAILHKENDKYVKYVLSKDSGYKSINDIVIDLNNTYMEDELNFKKVSD